MSVKELTELSLTDLWKEYQSSFKDFWEVSDEAMKGIGKSLLEGALKVEQWEYIGCSEYERSPLRQDSRNGYWKRWIILKEGRLEIKVPRLRLKGFESMVIPQYKQRSAEIDEG